jgi:superfamily II DNA/RNA helicase
MGQDYVARKARKKERKRMARDGAGRDRRDRRADGDDDRLVGGDGAPAAQKRVRKKANQPRRNCRGLCFQPAPVVTREDLRWDGRPTDPTGAGPGGADGSDDDGGPGGGVGGARGDVFFGEPGADPRDAAAAKYARVYERRTGFKVAAAPGEEDAKVGGKQQQQQTKEKKKKRKASSSSGGLSTGVRLLSADELQQLPSSSTQQKKARLGDDEGGGDGPSPAVAPIPPLLQPFPPVLARAMALLGHEEPTPVQSAAWPAALLPAGEPPRDLVAVAPTGSGKTLAFLLPAILRAAEAIAEEEAASASSNDGPRALVLAPTRELAQQTFAQAKAACRAVVAARAATKQGAAAGPRLRAAVVFGGAPLAPQAAELVSSSSSSSSSPLAVLVATPGRLLALADMGSVSLSAVRVAVLDEADRMLDVGFSPQLERIAAMLGLTTGSGGGAQNGGGGKARALRRPQVLLFTATMPPSVRKAAKAWTLHGAARVDAHGAAAAALGAAADGKASSAALGAAADGKASSSSAAALITGDPEAAAAAAAISPTVSQVVHVCADHKKPAKIIKHLRAVREQAYAAGKGRSPPRAIVFVNRVKTASTLRRLLADAAPLSAPVKPPPASSPASAPSLPPACPLRVEALHGAMPQRERDAAVAAFRAGKCHVLVATDVAARGLDVKGLPYVINYDAPLSMAAYAHRAGRTGRLAARGHCYTFLTRAQARLAPAMEAVLKASGQPLDPNLAALAEAWREVERRLGPAAAAAQGGLAAMEPGEEAVEGEEDEDEEEVGAQEEARRAPEDLHEGLLLGGGGAVGGGGAASASAAAAAASAGRQLRKAQEAAVLADVLGLPSLGKLAKKRAARAASGEDVMLVPAGPCGGGGGAAAGGGDGNGNDGRQQPPFVRSPRFAGARPGYAFRRGDKGVGYYLDVPLHLEAEHAFAKMLSPSSAGGGGGGKKQQQQKKKTKAPPAPKQGLAALPKLPGLARRQASDSDDDLDDEEDTPWRKVPPPPRKRQGAGGSDDDDGGDSDSDSDGGGGGKKRYKGALPGRLRKKLAKQRQRAGGGGGGVKSGGGGKGKASGRGAYNAGTSKAGRSRRV